MNGEKPAIDGGGHPYRNAPYVIAATLLAGAAVYGLVVAITSSTDTLREHAVPLFFVAAVSALVALLGWREDRARMRRLDEATAAAEQQLAAHMATEGARFGTLRAELEGKIAERDRALAEAQETRTRLEASLREREGAVRDRDAALQRANEHAERLSADLDRERGARSRLERARRAERDWNQELRGQIVRMNRERGPLGDTDDIRALVLHMAVTLLDAEKGLLLSRQDVDGDGLLDVVCAEGFRNDVRGSLLAQRFAGEVLARDEIVREDGRAVEDDDRTPADEEIDSVCAIPIYMHDQFSGAVVVANRDGGFEEVDDDVLLAMGDQAGAVLENGRLHGELRGAYLATIRVLAEAIQAKDPFLRGHSDEVSRYVAAVADELGVEPLRREQLVYGSLLHDVGKIGISERILLKPAALTQEERDIVNLYPRIGSRLVEQVQDLWPMWPGILHHQDCYDGGGYHAGPADWM